MYHVLTYWFRTLGFGRIEANALTSVGGLLSLAVVFLFAFLSDRTGKRGLTVALAIFVYLIALILLRTVHPVVGNKWRRYVLWTTVNSLAVAYHPIHNTWLQLNCTDPQERSIAIAMWVMSAITGLMAGSQIFTANDAPFYHTGVVILIAMVAFGLLVVGVQLVVYHIFNKRFEGGANSAGSSCDDIADDPQVFKEGPREEKHLGRRVPYVL